MSNETEFVNGLIVKAPNENAPEYVKAKLSIKNAELIATLQARLDRGEEWTNADIKVSSGGKWYAAVDNWKPNQEGGTSSARQAPKVERRDSEADYAASLEGDDIPFISNRGRF